MPILRACPAWHSCTTGPNPFNSWKREAVLKRQLRHQSRFLYWASQTPFQRYILVVPQHENILYYLRSCFTDCSGYRSVDPGEMREKSRHAFGVVTIGKQMRLLWQGAHGSVHALPPFLAETMIDDMAGGDIGDDRVLVQWRLPMQLGAGQILLLSIVKEQLSVLHRVSPKLNANSKFSGVLRGITLQKTPPFMLAYKKRNPAASCTILLHQTQEHLCHAVLSPQCQKGLHHSYLTRPAG
jgi:hypothetical protein